MKTPCIISFLWLIFLPTAKVFAKKTNPTVNRTLSASLLSINRTTGEVIINGVDTRGPSTPFTWFWGDGTSNNGFFPQTKTYADVNRSYVVKIIANYPNNEKDSIEVVVDFNKITTERTLSAWVQSINRTTGEVIISGVDTRGPSTPFTWFWGDGTSNNGFFPQAKTYADVNRSYVVKVISNYPNNEKDSVEVVVNFTALNLSGVAVSGIQQVEQTLISTQTIPPNTNVTYQAGNSISLQGTFSAQAGSVFKAEIKR